MGVAFLTPPSEHLRRRLIAGALALAINAGLVLALALLPRTTREAVEPDPVEVVFVTLEPPPVAEAEPEPEPEPEIIVDPVPPPDAETDAPADIPPELVAATPPAPIGEFAPDDEDEDRNEDRNEDGGAATGGGLSLAPPTIADLDRYGVQALPFNATNDTVRDILCFGTSESTRRAVACRGETGEDGLPLLRYASPENRARGEAAFAMGTPEQIRALFDEGPPLGLDDLSGQATLADTSQRPTSSADQMRDTLPPRHPDPAFGD